MCVCVCMWGGGGSQMTVVEGSGGQLRCCDRWRKSFDKEQRRAKVSKIWREGNKKKKVESARWREAIRRQHER